MAPLLPPWPLLSAFLAASLVLAVTPGPAVFYIVTRSLLQGRRAGLASVAGVALGSLGNALGAALGLAALLALFPAAFTLLKYAGALYLIYLGLQALGALEPEAKSLQPARLGRIFRDGLVVALLNPHTAIFFAAFLPQFLSLDAPPAQSIALGSLFVAIAASTDALYALAAGALGRRLLLARGARTFGRRLGASAFIGLGVLALFADIHGGS